MDDKEKLAAYRRLVRDFVRAVNLLDEDPTPLAVSVVTAIVPVQEGMSALVQALRAKGCAVDLVNMATWSEQHRDIARAWVDQGAKPEDRPEWLPLVAPSVPTRDDVDAAASSNRAALVARAYAEKLLTDESLDVDEAWVKLQYVAPSGWFKEPPKKKPVDLLGLLRANVAEAKGQPPPAPPEEPKKRGRKKKEENGESKQIDFTADENVIGGLGPEFADPAETNPPETDA